MSVRNRNQESVGLLFGGINNRLNNGLAKVSKGRVYDLESANNVYITDNYGIRTREGNTLVCAVVGSHSMFSAQGHIFFVGNGTLNLFDARATDYAVLLELDDPAARMFYVQAGSAVLFSNGTDVGAFVDGECVALLATTDTGCSVFPPARHLAWFNGRVYGAADDGLVFSETYNFEQVDDSFYKLPLGKITMIATVQGGIYVGCNNGVVFMQGTGPEDFIVNVIQGVAVIDGAYCLTDAKYFSDEASGVAVVYATAEGVFAGFSGGIVFEVTRERYVVGTGKCGRVCLHKHGTQASVYLAITKE